MKDYDTYLFDWDGTIVRSFEVWLKFFREILAKYGAEASDKAIVRQIFGRAEAGLMEFGVPEADLDEVFRKLDGDVVREMLQAPFYPGIRELLGKLHQDGKQTALVTASVRSVINGLVDAHGLHGAFDIIVTGDEVKEKKPDPEGILFTLAALGADKDRAVMLGDSEKDILAAHNAGIDSILFFPPEHDLFHDLKQLQADKPTRTIHSWQELTDAR